MSFHVFREAVKVNDNELAYFRFGNGKTPMVMLPGLGVKSVMNSAEGIASAYRIFTEAFTVYCFDRPVRLYEGITLKELAEYTAAAMNAVGVKNACIFGASQGGMMAQYIALEHPELAAALVLGSTTARVNPTFREVLRHWIALAEQGDAERFCDYSVDILYGSAYAQKYGTSIKYILRDITREEFRRFILLAKSGETFDVYDAVKAIACPVLVLGAENDRVLTAQASVELAGQIGCECYLYGSEYGHCVFDEAPDYRQRMFMFFTGTAAAVANMI